MNLKHGHYKNNQRSRTYNVWRGMVQRCTNINYKEYKYYGGRGITICERWLKFENFLKDIGEIPKDKEIDRINNNLGYYKENIKLSTLKEQARNKRNNIKIKINNEERLLIELAEEYGISYQTLYRRIYRDKWSIERALTIPVKEK